MRTNIKVFSILFTAVLVVALLSCTATTQGVTSITDQAGNHVDINLPINRIVSIYGISTYFVYTIGSSDQLVAAWYAATKGIDKATNFLNRMEPDLEHKLNFGKPNVEQIVKWNPDLVLANPHKHSKVIQALNEVGIPTIAYVTETPAAMKEGIRLTAEAIGTESAATRAEEFCSYYDRFRDEIPKEETVSVYLCGTDPLLAASGDMYQTSMINTAGAVSVSSKLSGYWSKVNLEQIYVWNPDIVIIAPYGSIEPSDIIENPDWQAITAVKNSQVYKMPRFAAPWDIPVPDSILGIMWLAKVFYPDRVAFDLHDQAQDFHRRFYGCALTDNELVSLRIP